MSNAEPPAEETRASRTQLLVLAAAIALSFFAGAQTWRLWRRLPGVQVRHIEPAAYQAAFERTRSRMSPEGTEGLVAVNLSTLFTAALRQPGVYAANRTTVEHMTARLRRTQLGRLQLAAFVMLELERAGRPVETWWPQLEPVLAGLQTADFPHFLPEVLAAQAAAFESLGLEPGAARVEARRVLGQPHGPFLEFFCDRLRRVAVARRAAGDDSARQCEELVRRLLRSWTLAPAPAGLRLLAADLLARDIESSRMAETPTADEAALADELRRWRDGYRTAAKLAFARTGTNVPLVSLHLGPEPAPGLYKNLVQSLATTLWAAAAGLAAAGATVVCLVGSLRTPRAGPTNRSKYLLTCASTVAAVTAVLTAVAIWWPELAITDLRCLGEEGLGWPRLPVGAALLTLALLALTALPRPVTNTPLRSRLAHVVCVAARVWLLWAVVVLGLTTWSGRLLSRHQEATRAALDGDEICAVWDTGVAGPAPTLEHLRRWNPAGPER